MSACREYNGQSELFTIPMRHIF